MASNDPQPRSPAGNSVRRHRLYGGKMQTMLKCPIQGPSDFAVWYTPGVADPCRAIQATPEAVYELTNKGNLVAVVSDGSRVLGLGSIGPEAGLPVMEGKSLLFKYLGGVDAVALCLATKTADELVQAVEWLAPSFGAINLEDIAQPKCFRVLETLRKRLTIPVWHDDQQGTATVVLAGLLNAAGHGARSQDRADSDDRRGRRQYRQLSLAHRLWHNAGIDRGLRQQRHLASRPVRYRSR